MELEIKVCKQRQDSLAVSELASEIYKFGLRRSSGETHAPEAIEKADVVIPEEEKDIKTSRKRYTYSSENS